MTLSPTENRNIIGLDGPKYELPTECCICSKQPVERHHAWRRSDVIGDRWWVYVPDHDVVIGNCVPLCNQCHGHMTDNYAKLEFIGNRYRWGTIADAAHELRWNPPAYRVSDEQEMMFAIGGRDFTPDAMKRIHTDDRFDKLIDRLHGAVDHDPNFCPACKRKIPKKAEKTETKKIRKTWSVAVPVDNQEDGADVLDTLIEEARKEMFDAGLPYGAEETAKYHVMASALGLFVLHAQSLMSDA